MTPPAYLTTINQPACRPQAKIFHLFDQLLLLNRGTIVYQGPAQDALDFFDRSGFPCPAHENPANHFLGTSSGARTHLLQLITKPDFFVARWVLAVCSCACDTRALVQVHPCGRAYTRDPRSNPVCPRLHGVPPVACVHIAY